MPPALTVRTLQQLNTLEPAGFVAELGNLFEHAPWVAEQAAPLRPFATVRAIHDAMLGVVRRASPDRQLALIRAHPELAGREAVAGTLTEASASEQSRLGLTSLAPSDYTRLADLNRRYRETFGMPCIIALRRHATLASVLAAFEQRIGARPDAEFATALAEIGHVTEGRLEARLGLGGGRLSTHVLDTARGLPAAGMAFTLHVLRTGDRSADWHQLAAGTTNALGRTDRPLIGGLDMETARFRLVFAVGDYYRGQSVPLAEPAFLDSVPIEFVFADAGQHYHVPLLCSPWSYSTYRGS